MEIFVESRSLEQRVERELVSLPNTVAISDECLRPSGYVDAAFGACLVQCFL